MIHTQNKFTRLVLIASMVLTAIAVIGTYSRGGFVGLGIVLAYLWWRSKAKFWIAIIGLLLLAPAIKFMPEKWVNRMDTIETADQDASMQGRLDAWVFAINVALDRPFVGGGFGVFYQPSLWEKYAPGRIWRAPHSIYFEVLGSHGFVGLAIFLALAAVAWRNAASIVRRTKGVPEFAWARDLAIMTQVSFVGYFVAGASMTMAFFDVYYTLAAVLAVLREYVSEQTVATATEPPTRSQPTRRRSAPGPLGWQAPGAAQQDNVPFKSPGSA